MAREPLVIKRMKKLAELGWSTSMDCYSKESAIKFSVWDSYSAHHTFLETYQELLTDLANRIIQAEAANGK